MIADDILYIGVDDRTLDLFEGQYPIPNGVSYNSYVILDEKVAVMDTVDHRKTDAYLENLERALGGRRPDYLVISHLEPDHASSIGAFLAKYPDTTLVGNAKTFQMLPQYFDLELPATLTVKEGDTLCLGKHTLTFVMAPMVHWPEVMVSYDSCDKVLFSADAFGKFGALDAEEAWDCEARRYYFNIVGKYGPQVLALLKKAAGLEIRTVCPLHGPGAAGGGALPCAGAVPDLGQLRGRERGGVFIAYASLHGNTAAAAEKLAGLLRGEGLHRRDGRPRAGGYGRVAGERLPLRQDGAGRRLLQRRADALYGGFPPPPQGEKLPKAHRRPDRERVVGPSAARVMKELLGQMKEITLTEPVITIRGALKPADETALAALADQLAG